MKKHILYVFISTIFISNIACSQIDVNKLSGKWRFADESECPDILDFLSHGEYNILNDCGSIDPEFPIIERGSWEFKDKEKTIVLSNREFVSPNSVFTEYHGNDEILVFKIIELSNTNLTLGFLSDTNNCISANFFRLLK